MNVGRIKEYPMHQDSYSGLPHPPLPSSHPWKPWIPSIAGMLSQVSSTSASAVLWSPSDGQTTACSSLGGRFLLFCRSSFFLRDRDKAAHRCVEMRLSITCLQILPSRVYVQMLAVAPVISLICHCFIIRGMHRLLQPGTRNSD